jgi:hypothetical protein
MAFLPIAAAAAPTVACTWQNSHPAIGQNLVVTVHVHDAPDLDTYSFEVTYDTAALKMIDAALDAPLMNINNVLRIDGQTLLPVIKKEAGKVTIAATLSGNTPTMSNYQNGVIGVMVFKVLRDPSDKIEIRNVRLLDSKGNKLDTVLIQK